MDHQDPTQYFNHIGMENRPPDILNPGPDLVANSAANIYYNDQYPVDPAYSQHQMGDPQQMYDPQQHYQYYDPHQMYYYQQQQQQQQQLPHDVVQPEDQYHLHQQPQHHEQLPQQHHDQLPQQHHDQLPQQHHDQLPQQHHDQLPQQHHDQLPKQHHDQLSQQHHGQLPQQHHDQLPQQHHDQLSQQHHDQQQPRQQEQLPQHHRDQLPQHHDQLPQHQDQQVPMEQQQREPVDGGNEAQPTSQPLPEPTQGFQLDYEDNVSMPMERLVLGESEGGHPAPAPLSGPPPPPMFSPIYPPATSSYPSMPYLYNDQVQNTSQGLYHPSGQDSSYGPPPPPSGDRFVAGEAEEQDRIVTGNSGQDDNPARPPSQQHSVNSSAATPSPSVLPPPPQSERSEAAGSDRRDESVMGPPPKSGLSPPPSTRRDVAGSDAVPNDRNKPKPQLPPPPTRNSQKPKVKEDYPYDSRRSNSDDDREEDESVFSQSSEAVPLHPPPRQQQQQQSKRGVGGVPPKQRPESLRHDSSSDLDERVNQRHQKIKHVNSRHERDQPRHDSHRSGKRDDRDRHHYDDRRDKRQIDRDRERYKGDERTFREDRSFRDDRSFHGGDREYRRDRAPGERDRDRDRERDPRYGTARKDRYSRPSSRAGSHYADDHRSGDWYYRRQPQEYMDQSMSYLNQSLFQPHYPAAMMHQQMAAAYYQQQQPGLDPTILETFRKNWEYYERNPKEKENLRLTNPTKYERLMLYYNSYSHLLPALTAQATDGPSSRASVHSGQSSVQHQGQPEQTPAKHEEDYNWLHQNESTIHPPDSALGISNYLPTLEGSDAFGGQNDLGLSINGNFESQPAHMIAPLKFSSPCVKGIFCPQGILVKIDAKSPLDGQNATVGLHSLQIILSREFKELKNYPGPLVPGRTHKGEVIQFCQSKVSSAKKSRTLIDRESYILIWELLILLMRQKNTIDGSDIAELLLKDRRDIHLPYASKNMKQIAEEDLEDDPSDLSEDDPDKMQPQKLKSEAEDTEAEGQILPFAQELERTTSKFRDYLLFGHKKEGLEYAMNRGLWGHALFLASKMDERTYSSVMLRFANGLAVNDPLQTLYQLMSGRQPIAVKECADQNWGDWRPHLAMILSNAGERSDLFRKSILTLGDTLLDKGLLYGAHFCYLVGNIEFGTYSNRNSKLVLIGSDHHLPFEEFASNEAIQFTEIFEYAQRLSNPDFVMHTLTYYKFTYIIRLMDSGRVHTALHYIEELSKVLGQHPHSIEADQMEPRILVNQLLQLAEHLKFFDPMYTTGEGEIADMGDPVWLINLRNLVNQLNSADWSNYTASNMADSTDANSHQPEGQEYSEHEQQLYDPGQYYGQYQPTELQKQESQEHVQQEQNQQAWGYPSSPGSDEGRALDPNPTHEEDPSQGGYTGSQPESSADPSSVGSSSQASPVHAPLQPVPTFSSQPPSLPPLIPSGTSGNYFSSIQSPQQKSSIKPPEVKEPPKKEEVKPSKPAEKKKSSKKDEANSTGLFGKLLGKMGIKTTSRAHLPEDKDQSIVWDEKTKRWVDKNASEDEMSQSSMAPPSDVDLSRSNSSANFGAEPPKEDLNKIPLNNNTLAPPMGNKYVGGFGKRYGGSVGRVDIFKASQSSPSLSTASLPPLIPTLAPIEVPAMLTPDAEPVSNGTEPSSPVTSEPQQISNNVAPDLYYPGQPQQTSAEIDPNHNLNGAPQPSWGQPEQSQDTQQWNGQTSWTGTQADAGDTLDSNPGQPLSAPMFFNPSQFGGPPPTTRRNKYA